ncbi:MerR family transcriptional regulator [Photobacterium aphoticum]|uniref:Methyltransferase n=1 Tax=Photobacterium aphoticum TaxID=754436 RepID=A0A0J1GH84_9GAMM|nr:MerR family transcriptional regulator [Photobacterium aphoticum]KLU99082.1 methyltransferase [Photobacterium aphoticum]PSU54662.1 methyltransferase domain-containing protein [Photobacterium aphoticum]GHA45747.1 methyltransferase [Photobacterium aphoticum]
MYRISQLAEKLGLSRTTLLYYEKLGLIKGQRLANGYRTYTERDVQRLTLLQNLQAGGLTLKECQACLDSKVERDMLVERLRLLDEEITHKQRARQLLAAMLGESSLTEWHQTLDQHAPEAHIDWLMKQGFDEKQAMRLKWLSKDMNTHDQYMADFMAVFNGLERWGPGSQADTLNALAQIPHTPHTILEIGCGRGIATQVLAAHTPATITATDNEEKALAALNDTLNAQGHGERITTVCANMADLPFAPESFDVIWSECSAYIMGVEAAFNAWRSLLQTDGILVLSDLVWREEAAQTLSESIDNDTRAFWQQEYPDMTTVAVRLAQAEAAGYRVIDHFALSDDAWLAYYGPFEARLEALQGELEGARAYADMQREIAAFHARHGAFDYQMFILQKR